MNPPSPQLEVESRPKADVDLHAAVAPAAPGVTIDELLRDLRASPTDLAKLVTSVHQQRVSVVAISSKAMIRWGRDDPDSWKRVQGWLSLRGVRVVET
jgi:hypothetical protein